MTATASSGAPRASSASSANTSEARPRGPNQPTNRTVFRSRPAPIEASATGSMRTTVRLSTAYTSDRGAMRSSMMGTAMAPKASHTSRDTRPPICSTNTSSAGPRRPATAPNASPPQNAATNPLPSSGEAAA